VQSNLVQTLGKIDLNRKLRDYPPVDANGLFAGINLNDPTNPVTIRYFNALQDRQNLAADLFEALWRSVGAADPATVTVDTAEFKALRWLAQLAVNIVDYIDADNYSTPFRWYNRNGRQEYVFGVELPRLVINELYVQLDNNPRDLEPIPGTNRFRVRNGGSNHINIWAELLNPLPAEPANPAHPLSQDCTAQLSNGTPGPDQPYRIVLAQSRAATFNALHNPANTEGDPAFGDPAVRTSVVEDWPTTPGLNAVKPMLSADRFHGTADRNVVRGFYLVAPPTGNYQGPAGANPNMQAADPGFFSAPRDPHRFGIHRASQMYYPVDATLTVTHVPRPLILLRRLANPGLPYNNTKADPTRYNPYVTVDFVDFGAYPGQINDGRLYTTDGPVAAGNVTPMPQRHSWGRPQPYAAEVTLWHRQQPQPPETVTPQHTFFRHNAISADPSRLPQPWRPGETLTVPFEWLVHLDRPLISPMELWHVAGCKPHELTQVFTDSVSPSQGGNRHAVKWVNQGPIPNSVAGQDDGANRLYRFLECVGTGPRGSGTAAGGRIPGRVNINAVWNGEILRALADPQTPDSQNPNAFFTQADVDAVSWKLFQSRSPGGAPALGDPKPYRATPLLRPTDPVLGKLNGHTSMTELDKPFWSLGVGPANGTHAHGTPADRWSYYPDDWNGTARAHIIRGGDSTLLRAYDGPVNAVNPIAYQSLFDPPSAFNPHPPPYVPATHPYMQKQLLTKIYNHLTTRSNVFAVWLTVGFFEVDDQGQLGAEINKVENRQIRHRLFALVDRSQMTLHQQTLANSTGSTVWTPGNPVTFTLGTGPDPRSGRTWNPPAGTLLTLDEGQANEETIRVIQTNGGNTVRFNVNLPHGGRDAGGNGIPITVRWRGNPGPWTQQKYDPRLDTDVVPFFCIID
jgi:hypothetical protein